MTNGMTAVAVVEIMEINANIRARLNGNLNSVVTFFIVTSPCFIEASYPISESNAF